MFRLGNLDGLPTDVVIALQENKMSSNMPEQQYLVEIFCENIFRMTVSNNIYSTLSVAGGQNDPTARKPQVSFPL